MRMGSGSPSKPDDSLGSDVLDSGIPREGKCVFLYMCMHVCEYTCACVDMCVHMHCVPVIRGTGGSGCLTDTPQLFWVWFQTLCAFPYKTTAFLVRSLKALTLAALLPPQFMTWKELLILSIQSLVQSRARLVCLLTQASLTGRVLPGKMKSFRITLHFKLTSPPQVSAEGQSEHSHTSGPSAAGPDHHPLPCLGHC